MALSNLHIFTLENLFHQKLTKNIPVKFEDTVFETENKGVSKCGY